MTYNKKITIDITEQTLDLSFSHSMTIKEILKALDMAKEQILAVTIKPSEANDENLK